LKCCEILYGFWNTDRPGTTDISVSDTQPKRSNLLISYVQHVRTLRGV